MTKRRGIVIIMVAATWLSVAGCAATFGDKLQAHRDCIGEAQIEPAKVDLCLRNTNGHREHVDTCLRDEMIIDRQITALDECVEERAQRAKP